MFRFIKKLLGSPVQAAAQVQPMSSPATSAASGTRQPLPAPAVRTLARLALPLNAILAQLPGDLQARVNQSYATQVDVLLATEKILPQLARGSVKLSFGELRRAAPPGTFSDQDDLDQVLVELPLSEILSRLDPALLARRPPQKKVEPPAGIAGPFGAKGQGLVIGAPPSQPFTAPTQAPAAPRPRPALQPAPEPVQAPAAIPAPAALRDLAVSPAAAPREPSAPVAAPTVAREPDYLMVVLGELSQTWPEGVRQEILQLNLSGAIVALPMDVLANELKHGKVTFTWKLLRSMIKPLPVAAAASVHDGIVLDLPLKIIAPLFLARQRASKSAVKVPLAQDIPDLFSSSLAQPAATSAPQFIPAKPAPTRREEETNYYIWGDDADKPVDLASVSKPAAAPAPPATDFLKRFPTPNEIVRKAAALEGVAGTLIALADGLLVAKELPPDMNGETLAAFLPQIFGRTSQSARELKMGELNNLNFTVGNTPWKIFRVGGMYFAAFGRAGEPLPTAQLVTIVGELDRKTK
ncbi:MAG: hypothetical protein HY298_11150 [Verrucomicrobia bacterium]|nr:hypothetical protein [Verrucomicrobiota bacterium]